MGGYQKQKLLTAMNITISKTISVGDAGTPFGVNIEVEYELQGNLVAITYCLEDDSPYDNPPELWFAQIKEAVEDYFYDVDKTLDVIWLHTYCITENGFAIDSDKVCVPECKITTTSFVKANEILNTFLKTRVVPDCMKLVTAIERISFEN